MYFLTRQPTVKWEVNWHSPRGWNEVTTTISEISSLLVSSSLFLFFCWKLLSVPRVMLSDVAPSLHTWISTLKISTLPGLYGARERERKRESLWSHVMYTYPSLLLFDLFMVFVSSVVEKKNFSPILAFIFRVRAGEWAWIGARLPLWGDGWWALLCVEEVYLKRSLMDTQGCLSFMWIQTACLSLELGAGWGAKYCLLFNSGQSRSFWSEPSKLRLPAGPLGWHR